MEKDGDNQMINEAYTKKYCCEDPSLIENYELAVADTTQTWEIHHRGEILPYGRFSSNDLKKFGLYFNRPASELIFLTHSEHRQLHLKGVPKSEATKKAISEAHKGVTLNEDHRKAISDAKKGVPTGPMSDAHKKAIGEALSKKILQFTKSGDFIREWSSMNEAMRQTGIGNIYRCCRGITKYAGGFIWQYSTL